MKEAYEFLQAAQLDAVTSDKEKLLWQTFFTKLLLGPKDETKLTSILKNLAQPHLQKFAVAIAAYLKEELDSSRVPIGEREHLSRRSKLAQKLLQGMKRII